MVDSGDIGLYRGFHNGFVWGLQVVQGFYKGVYGEHRLYRDFIGIYMG